MVETLISIHGVKRVYVSPLLFITDKHPNNTPNLLICVPFTNLVTESLTIEHNTNNNNRMLPKGMESPMSHRNCLSSRLDCYQYLKLNPYDENPRRGMKGEYVR